MKTELELEFKKETGLRPNPQNNLMCPECGEILMAGDFYTSDYVDFLIDKIEKYENSKRDSEAN